MASEGTKQLPLDPKSSLRLVIAGRETQFGSGAVQGLKSLSALTFLGRERDSRPPKSGTAKGENHE
jgi:hypothetical protein